MRSLTFFTLHNVFPAPAGEMIRQTLLVYVTSVYNDELKRMSQGEISLHSNEAMLKLITMFYQLDEKSVPNREIYAEALKRLNNLAEYRRLRIFAGNDTVPAVVWLVLLVGSVISISYTYFFGMKNIRAQYLIAGSLTVTITMILFLIYVLDHPFTGTSKVSSEPLKQVMQILKSDERSQPSKLISLASLLLCRFPLRFVLAIRRSSALLIDLYIPREAPLSDDLERLPRLAESAAPAAICCFFDFAGIQIGFASQTRTGFIPIPANFRQKKYAGTPVKTMRIPIPDVAGARKPRSTINNPAISTEMMGTNG